MLNAYDWDTNTLEIKDKYKNHFILQLRGNRNIIKGESGTGKSFLNNFLYNAKHNQNINKRYNTDNLFILNMDNKSELDRIKGKLIIIDRADLILTDDDVETINQDHDNRYLLFAREPLGIELSPNHQADLITDKGITFLKYRFNVKGWC
jgi:IstB-like ATP binding protein.